MLRIKGTKDVPQFQINDDKELTCSGGTPGTWTKTTIDSSANGFTNKTPYSGVVHYSYGSGYQGTKRFEPNEFVVVPGVNVKVLYIVMMGGGAKKSSDSIPNKKGRDQK